MAVKLVTGYVPLAVRHRSLVEYHSLGSRLLGVDVTRKAFVNWPLSECWMYKFLKCRPPVTYADGGDPGKNTLDYHIVQHQKVEWLLRAAMLDPDPDVFVWVDYAVFHMGVSPKQIVEFVRRVGGENEITIPGCWPKGQNGGPCWRFCGTVLICPRDKLLQLDTAIKVAAAAQITVHNHVTWEVNTWADVEASGIIPIKWYKANHDASLFTNYGA